jgi:hypothetical protein
MEAGLALSATRAVDAFQGKAEMTEDLGKDFVTGENMVGIGRARLPRNVTSFTPRSVNRGP